MSPAPPPLRLNTDHHRRSCRGSRISSKDPRRACPELRRPCGSCLLPSIQKIAPRRTRPCSQVAPDIGMKIAASRRVQFFSVPAVQRLMYRIERVADRVSGPRPGFGDTVRRTRRDSPFRRARERLPQSYTKSTARHTFRPISTTEHSVSDASNRPVDDLPWRAEATEVRSHVSGGRHPRYQPPS